MTVEFRNQVKRPRPGPVAPSAVTQEHLARAMRPTVYCPQPRLDTCLREYRHEGSRQ